MKLKCLVLFLSIVFSCALYFWEAKQMPSNDLTVKDFTNLKLKTIHGDDISLQKVSAESLLLHFWATWCAPCVEELPTLVEFTKKTPNIKLIAISVDTESAIIPSFLEKLHINITSHENIIWAHDPNQEITNKIFNVYQFPETLVLNEKKQLIRTLVGAQDWSNITLFK